MQNLNWICPLGLQKGSLLRLIHLFEHEIWFFYSSNSFLTQFSNVYFEEKKKTMNEDWFIISIYLFLIKQIRKWLFLVVPNTLRVSWVWSLHTYAIYIQLLNNISPSVTTLTLTLRERPTRPQSLREKRGWGAAISGGGRRRQRSGGVRLTETIDQNMTAPNYIKC